ncbi:hypothetical protein AM501_05380 [Aneurinibacillus migulanus]|uniref:SNF2-related protein n=1 Tax=Aneurinibacillus migulanus TaxID=47500 RepID=UPI0005BA2E7B|nr:SNF2-related protein [Aneurinibacillus migulanus]KIV58561.1 hypothetical protein TS64_04235 [Aneurinibacillus migulanus]KPD09267.1 hypothetical protein AM501_05380 [Aneurinibacillus migulanus]
MKLNYNSKVLTFNASNLLEKMEIGECLASERMDKGVSWHYMITSNENIRDMRFYQAFQNWGIEVEEKQIDRISSVVSAKHKRYKWDIAPIETVMMSPKYYQKLKSIEDNFSGILRDGTSFFPFQKTSAAVFNAKRRLLLAFEMGLGKTRTTLLAFLSDKSNKKCIIVTMSRNINDWVREIKNMGYENEYIILRNPRDLHSDKRIHLVSYEKWATDRIKFKRKHIAECPHCNLNVYQGRQRHKVAGYCGVVKKRFNPLSNERYSEEDMPEYCPCCNRKWEGRHECVSCGFSVIESRKKPLYMYYHNGYECAAIDEAHYIKNGKSKRAQSILKITAPKRIALSGTPAENGADDLFWIIGWLTGFTSRFEDPTTKLPFRGYGKVGEEHFRQYYSGGGKRRVLDIDSVQPRASHHEKLWALLDSLMIRKKQDDPDVNKYTKVPEPIHHREHLKLHDAERELYDQLLMEFKLWYENELQKKKDAEERDEKYRISTIEICTWMECALFPDNLL